MKLASATQMQSLDRCSIEEYGIPGIVLMENAGRGTVDFMLEHLGPVRDKSVLIFAGPGNNGGDGLVIARHVHQGGGLPCIFFLIDPDRLKGDAALNYQIVQKLRLPVHTITSDDDLSSVRDIITELHVDHPVHSLIDAIFGTGLTREVEGHFLTTINLINTMRQEHGWPVVAVDIPSGLNADNGRPLGGCVQADLTATYGLAKPVHYMHGGKHIGRLKIVDIGIPAAVIDNALLPGEALDESMTELLQLREAEAHKGTFGHLLILAGGAGKTGAAILSARGALHSGAGLVTLAVPHRLNVIFEPALIEAMTVPLPSSKNALSIDDFDRILELSRDKRAVVLGPGIGTEEQTILLVLRLYTELNLPMVIDADALNILALHPDTISSPAGPRIFTPHPGEMSRLTGLSSRQVQKDRLTAAVRFTKEKKQLITVLKGAGTIIAGAGGKWAVNTTGNSGMATGGMGDVLAGLIGSLLAQNYTPWDAAKLGVYLHGLAADLLAETNAYGYLASDVAATLPRAIKISRKT